MYKIKVTNTRTNREYVHDNIDERDLRWIKSTPSLEIKILKTYTEDQVGRDKDEKGTGSRVS